MGKLSRRDFIKVSGGAAAAAGLGAAGGLAAGLATPARAAGAKTHASLETRAPLPKAKGQRIVVVGGGWSGLTAAKYIKQADAKLDVVLVEKNATFMSCPISNLWLTGLVDLEFLTHSYLDAAKHNDYLFFNATVVDLDRTARKLYTDQGFIHYDYLLLSPGIDYDYAAIGVADPADEFRLRSHYPAGFMPGSEHVSIRNKLEDFDGGAFLLTVPAGNYRCLPGPYERACLIASYFKREKITGKVILLDANPDVTIKKEGFHAAFDQLYKDTLEYHTSFTITGVDVDKRRVLSEFGEVDFADAAIYPKVRASKLIETVGLVDPKSLQREARIEPLTYNVVGDERVYVAGDARPMPFSKSGNTANSEAKFVASIIVARAHGKSAPKWQSPNTVCFSVVNGDPMEAISVDAHYAYNPQDKSFAFDQVKMFEERDAARGAATLDWARGLYRDMFA
jgi:sulfide dehydrogenase [flavocytochrome c] flavoprotein subunit